MGCTSKTEVLLEADKAKVVVVHDVLLDDDEDVGTVVVGGIVKATADCNDRMQQSRALVVVQPETPKQLLWMVRCVVSDIAGNGSARGRTRFLRC